MASLGGFIRQEDSSHVCSDLPCRAGETLRGALWSCPCPECWFLCCRRGCWSWPRSLPMHSLCSKRWCQRAASSGCVPQVFPVLAERGSQSKFLVKDVLKVSIEWLEFSSGITAPVCLAGAGCSRGCLRRAAEDRPCRWWSMAPHGGCNTRGEVRWPQSSAGSWQSKKKEKRYR